MGNLTERHPLQPKSSNVVTMSYWAKLEKDENMKALISSALKRPHPDDETNDDGESEIDEDDPRLDLITWDCNQVRRMIRNLLENKEMKVGEFCKTIGNSQNSYRNFMGMSGKEKGAGSDTYINAHRFFRKRELEGIPPPKKKTKTTATKEKVDPKKAAEDKEKGDVSGVQLEEYADREADHKVPIFETCDSMRKQINAHLRNTDETQAALARHFSEIMGKKIQGAQVGSFLGKKGPRAGASSPVFYAAYVYFEKLRIKQGKKKGVFRQEMEDRWTVPPKGELGIGFTREDGSRVHLLCFTGEGWNFDKYGMIQMHGR